MSWTPVVVAASRMGQVEEYYFSRKLKEIARLRETGNVVINLGIGSPDMDPDPEVTEALAASCRQSGVHGYQSYSGQPALRQAFARWYQTFFSVELHPDKEILPLMGSKEGIMHISMAWLESGDEALVPDPGYPAYASVTRLTGAHCRTYRLEEGRRWQADLDFLACADLSRVKLMWLNYPNMPTGAPADPGYFADLIQFALQHGILLVHDNPYAFVLNPKPLSLLSLPGAMEVALELNSLSKAHNLAGWRIGMVAGAEGYLTEILRFRSNMDSGMFHGLQQAAVRALELPPSWYAKLNETYACRREKAEEVMKALGCQVAPGQVGMFLWGRVPTRFANAWDMADALLDETRLFITPGGIFGEAGTHYLRISLCSPVQDFREALERIRQSNLHFQP